MQLANNKNDYLDKFSIGIPTYEAGESLVSVIKSISSQTAYSQIDKIIIAVDGNKIPSKILNQIKEKKMRVVYFKNRQGQSARINDLFKLAKTEKLVLTNDDVVLAKDALAFIQSNYQKFDLIAGNIKSLSENNLFVKSLMIGQNFRSFISESWNNGDNYLSCNGRLIILSKKLYKKISIPEKIWNNDAYIYLMAKELKLKVAFAKEIKAFYKSPSTFKEHLSQSSKFQKSTTDLQRYFKDNISGYYNIPKVTIIKSLLINSLKYPLLTVSYFGIFAATRFQSYFSKADFWNKSFWETDKSTKALTKI